MKKLSLALLTTTALLTTACASDEQKSHDHKHGEGNLHLKGCAIQQTIPGAKATGAFLTIHKHGEEAVSLVSASAPTVTDHVEIHEMIMKDGKMKMSQIMDYPLKTGNNVFKKGGYHIMLMELDKVLAVGEKHDITFKFSDDSSETCTAEVKSVEELTPKGMKMHKHDHGEMKHDEGEKTHVHDDGKKHDHS